MGHGDEKPAVPPEPGNRATGEDGATTSGEGGDMNGQRSFSIVGAVIGLIVPSYAAPAEDPMDRAREVSVKQTVPTERRARPR